MVLAAFLQRPLPKYTSISLTHDTNYTAGAVPDEEARRPLPQSTSSPETFQRIKKWMGFDLKEPPAPVLLDAQPSLATSAPKTTYWHRVVEGYSKRVLTYPTDQLPALSGLAREMARLFNSRKDSIANEQGCRYYAGLWENSFIRDLCWEKTDPVGPSVLSSYIAPSWSWTSFPRAVRILFQWPGEYRSHPLARLVDLRLSYMSDESYGAVKDGWVVLRGYLRRVEDYSEGDAYHGGLLSASGAKRNY
ncbi:uncharacterized protein B0I36DRAFT_434275 [Microdochium trichocladiopsis]|uniref:Uncharacterized protein n=1 Tax=Microdochium trichocladiopsis TaxID=1682393 RepID=A0A9P8XXE2_9PEZI|nr:uncharacterized protein B0I36DRAFT_434275 [Microdochium trichocladiopsis]KAH7024588.1 hypothetical protein B0I36DRAFT_434275 [Microdochium trichocladiopsis]